MGFFPYIRSCNVLHVEIPVKAHCQRVADHLSILPWVRNPVNAARAVLLITDDDAGAADLERRLAPHVLVRSWSPGGAPPEAVLVWRAVHARVPEGVPPGVVVDLGEVSPELAALRAQPRIEAWRDAALVEDLPFAGFVCERGALRVLVANAAAARLYGATPEWFLGRSLHDLRAEGQARRLGGQAKSSAPRFASGVRHCRVDGTEVVVGLQEAPGGGSRCIVLVQPEGGAEPVAPAVRDFPDVVGNPVVVFDAKLRVVRANAAAFDLSRATGGALVRPQKAVWCDASGAELARKAHPVVRALETRRAVRGLVLGVRSGAKVARWMQVDAIPQRARDGVSVVFAAVDVTALMLERERVRASLTDVETLLSEVRHRVRNNLQLVRSLTQVQARACRDAEGRAALHELEQRVAAMAFVHERLSGLATTQGCDLEPRVRELAKGIVEGAADTTGRINLRFQTEPVFVRASAAMPVALVLNELVHNALKHAFPQGKPGTVTVELRAPGTDGLARLAVSDDGEAAGDVAPHEGSLGVRIVKALARQLGGQVAWASRKGVTATLHFPAIRAAKRSN